MNSLSGTMRFDKTPERRPTQPKVGMEANMAMTTTETMVIDILRQEGEQTIESLWQRSGLDWVQVFGAIDHLSRLGEVSLRRAPERHYHVSLTGMR